MKQKQKFVLSTDFHHNVGGIKDHKFAYHGRIIGAKESNTPIDMVLYIYGVNGLSYTYLYTYTVYTVDAHFHTITMHELPSLASNFVFVVFIKPWNRTDLTLSSYI